VRAAAVKHYIAGVTYRRTARQFGVSHRSVMNWAKARAEQLPEQPPQPDMARLEVNELDERFTFVETKKTSCTS
jgi:transposase-like protein